jgi:hypothetical protein
MNMNVTIQNIRCFIRRSLADLKTVMPSDHHKWKSATVKHIGGITEQTKSTRPDFENILGNLNVQEKLSGKKNFETILREDTRFEKIWKKLRKDAKIDIFGFYSLLPEEIMQATLEEYMWQVESLQFDEEIAKTVAKNFVASLDSGKVSFVDFSVVRGLYTDFEEHQLPSGLRLRKIEDEEASRLVDRYKRIDEEDNLAQNSCIVERTIEFELGSKPPSIIDSHEKFEQVVRGLRILKEGQVDHQNTFRRSCFPGQIGVFPNSTYHLDKRHAPIESFNLSEDELPKLITILKAILLKTVSARLRIAVERLSDAILRPKADDRLLDLIICLEALFGDDQGAAGYKIGLRSAVIVGNNYRDRQEIFKLVQQAYRRRSALVHGSRKKHEDDIDLTPKELAQKLANVTRKSLLLWLRALATGRKPPQSKDIDDRIFRDLPLSE